MPTGDSQQQSQHVKKSGSEPSQRQLKKEYFYRRRPLALARHYLPSYLSRPIIWIVRRIDFLWAGNSGEWQWLEQKPVPLKLLSRNLWQGAHPSLSYYIMLFISGVISTLGLLAGSTAAIIGAMIVAPLMGPIVAVAYAITAGNRRLLKRSGYAVFSGCLLTILSAYIICQIVGINTLNSEITQRTHPTLIDLIIGLAAGAAGSFAQTRRNIADALPGVAIAVALVPPLSVIGIGLAIKSTPVAFGSTLLFLTNLAGIILSGGLVFIWQNYGSLERAKRGLTTSVVFLCILGIPLGISMKNLVVEERVRSLVSNLIRQKTITFRSTRIRELDVDADREVLAITLTVDAVAGSISANQINLVHKFLEGELSRPIELYVSVSPTEQFEVRQLTNEVSED